MESTARIYVAGHTGLIGSALVRRLSAAGYRQIIVKPHRELELTDAAAVNAFFESAGPEYVLLAAGRVGGIVANQSYPADFITENLAIQLNILRAAHRAGVKRLVLFASSCMYPRDCPQPMAEERLLTGMPEPTSLPYAIAKLAGVQMCLAYNRQYGEKRYIPVIPNSAYGPNDNFDPASGHVLSALIARFHEARKLGRDSVTLWGSGQPRREFLYADDLADACLMLLGAELSDVELPLNIGTGSDCTIRELAESVARVVGFCGRIEWDTARPDGAPRKLLDSTRIRSLGWSAKTDLAAGIRDTYRWFLNRTSRDQVSLRRVGV